MKRILLYSFVIASSGLLLATSCKKEDKEDPVVTLIGEDTITITSGKYVEYGATATDNEDGKLVPVITNTININTVGTYKITYAAYDNSGNKGGAIRIVYIKQFAKSYEGNYQMNRQELDSAGNVIATVNYPQTLTASTVYNNYVTFSKILNVNFSPSSFKIFGKLDRENKIITVLPPISGGNKTGTTFSVAGPEKTVDAHKIDGSGTIVTDSLFNFTFTDSISRTVINLTLPPANDTVLSKLVKRYNVAMSR